MLQISLWKRALIVLLSLAALVYATPNLFYERVERHNDAVLAMAAARVWPQTVLASDIDAVAVEVAEANVTANGLAGRVTCLEAVGFDHPEIRARAPFDLIFANILKGPLILLAADMARHAAPGGLAILSGLLNTQADDVLAAYAAQGFETVARDEIGEWTTLVLRAA